MQEAGHSAAALGLAQLSLQRGDLEEAERLIETAGAVPEAQGLRTRLRLRRAGRATDMRALQQRLEANPRDVAAHYELGLALAADEAYTSALDHLLEAVKIDRSHADDGARKAMIDLFTLLGDDDPRTRDYRQRLSNVLF